MDIGLGHAGITLESRFTDLDQPVLLTGIQALLRLLLEQRRLDMAAGLKTAALVSGYRGSPLGGLDRELWAQKKLMAAHDIRFEPGVNEDLAATMLYGTQELDAFPGARVDGVYGMWYGKGPGVDRTGDAFHCANMSGTHKHGGILAIAGDDHGAHSSTYPHQTEYVFQNCFIPVLNPGLGAGRDRPGAGRLGDVALRRRLGGDEDDGGDDGAGVHRHRAVGAPVRHAGYGAAAAWAEFRSDAAFPGRSRRTGTADDRGTHAGGAGLGAGQPDRPADQRVRRRDRSAW